MGYKHSHTCIYSSNKYSELEFITSLKVKRVGVSSNVLLETFSDIKFENKQNKTDEYEIELNGFNEGNLNKCIKASFHDDCFFEIEFNDMEDIKRFILGIINMQQEYISINGCIKERDISDSKVEEIVKNKKVSFKTIGTRVVILNHYLNLLEQKFPKVFIKEKDVLFG